MPSPSRKQSITDRRSRKNESPASRRAFWLHSVGAAGYLYDARNHLRAADGRTYAYDGRGVRVATYVPNDPEVRASRPVRPLSLMRRLRAWFAPPRVSLAIGARYTTNTTTEKRKYSFYTPELNLMAETETTTAMTPAIAYEYVWFAGEPLAQIETPTAVIHYYFNDHLGAPILTTNATGVVDWRVEREPYGKVFTIRVGPTRYQPFVAAWQEDDEPDRAYNIFRWYRAGWSRYTQPDRLGLASGINLYTYVHANPLRYSDALGLQAHPMDFINCAENPIACARVFHCDTKALHAVLNRYGGMQDDTESNAYYHCYWNCCMAQIIGAQKAKKFGDAHEAYPGNAQCQMEMDQFNNDVGRRAGSGQDCDGYCASAPLMKKPRPGCSTAKCGKSEDPNYADKKPRPMFKQPSDW